MLLGLLLACTGQVFAQGEVLQALRARPTAQAAAKADGPRTYFIYQFQTQTLPIADDFSVDRTTKRWAQPGDPNVTLTTTFFHLEVAGVSEPDMVFSLDTTFLYTTDLQEPPVTTRAALPSVNVTVRNLDVYPPTESVQELWPAYNVYDTIQSPSPDTLELFSNVLEQDSLLVYTVAADTRTYTRPDNSLAPWVLWEDDDVLVNGTFGNDPPTVGVATFDGLSRTGMPYDFVNYTNYGIADHLTSVPIDLQYPASDSIYLSFFYQAQGLSGDMFGQPQDSLVLEFYAPEEDIWYRVWRSPYIAPGAFQQVLIPIKQFRYLKNGFRMRFLNYATLSGAFDHWHIDYVRLGAQRTFDDTRLIDVAYVIPESTLLRTYTSMPYNAFSASPSAFMTDTAKLSIRNLDVDDRFIVFGFQAREENGAGSFLRTSGNNTSNNALLKFTARHPVQAGSPPFAYDPALSTDAAFWRVKFWSNTTPDINRYNDTTSFIQEISNYYAYDDGSAEMTYGLNSAGAKLAYRFDLPQGDTLRAVRMYFSPSLNPPPGTPPTQGSFLITVWTSLAPEVIQHQNFSFSSPEYRDHGPDHYVEYPLDSAIFVQGTVYIGWTQTNSTAMNLGFDRNRDVSDRIFFATTGTFANTAFDGALMMRPVFVAAVDPFTGVEEPLHNNRFTLYPNPATDEVRIMLDEELPAGRAIILDALGRQVMDLPYRSGGIISTSTLAPGLHIVRLLDAAGTLVGQERLIIQR